MTEDQALTKDCCGPTGCGVWVNNRRLCIGTRCMAWRLHGGVGPTGVPNVASTDGYCGIAGKPA